MKHLLFPFDDTMMFLSWPKLCRVLLVFSMLVVCVPRVIAEGTDAADKVSGNDKGSEVECRGSLYVAKRDAVPIFEEPDLTAAVIGRLEAKEKVCYVGEQGGFAIVDWSKGKKAKKLVFVRLVDLWQSANRQSRFELSIPGVFGKVKQYIHYIMSGGVPEDPLLPYRPLINTWTIDEPESSTAGKGTNK